jgi:endonuclease/exonuclease/phosphatase family metal-dependent hydrolase
MRRATAITALAALAASLGFVHTGSLARPGSPATVAASDALVASAWSSGDACLAALRRRAPAAGPRPARIAAWNLEWFPDGSPGTRAKAGKDLEWLACALALLDADVFVLTEVKAHPRARVALDAVLRHVESLGGGAYRAAIDPCGTGPGQHVALVWNSERVQNRALELYGELNPHGSPCEGQLRPGYGGYFRFAGGLDLELIGVHLKSGTDERSFGLRRRSWAALAGVRARAQDARKDDDLVVLGDFNTMGCAECSPRVRAETERAELDRAETDLGLLATSPACSHYYHRRSGLLDLALVRRRMRELPPASKVSVSGYCAERNCRPLGDEVPAAKLALSDHCPIVLELVDRDLD